MADAFTKFDNSAKDLPNQVQADLKQANYMFQTYGDKKVTVGGMFGKANQVNTMNGSEMASETRGRKK